MKGGSLSEDAKDASVRVGSALTREALARARRKALRQRCWYRALNKLERTIVDLTIRCVEQVKSTGLRTALKRILAKLVQALRASYLDIIERIGRPLAARASRLAKSWGNMRAAQWKNDSAFTRYLGVNALNREISGLGRFGT